MSLDIITSPSQAADNANYALRTYYNYIRAWLLSFEQQHGSGQDGITEFSSVLKQSADIGMVQAMYSIPQNLHDSYNRGKLTWDAIKNLPIDGNPKLAISANFWLPVQTYYTTHGFGVACLIALNRTPPSTHSAFRTNFSEIIRQYFPPPICAQCSGGPEKESFNFPSLPTNAADVIAQNNLQTPSPANAEKLIGKSLSTTRQDAINERFINKRKKEKKRNLSRPEKCEICEKIPATSICDLLYRMRVRSNYENPDMYIFADPDEASNHYKGLRYLTEVLIAGLRALLEVRLGPLMDQL